MSNVTVVRSARLRGLDRRDRTLVGCGLALALLVRVAIVVKTHGSYAPIDDAADFSRIAVSIAHGHGFGRSSVQGAIGPSAFRAPLWPGLLGAVYAVTGVSWTAGRLLLAVVGTGVVGAIGALGRHIAGRKVGLVALYVAAVYPPLVLGGYQLNYEPVMALFILSAMLCGLRWRDRPGQMRWLVLAGILSGLAVLCRENGALVLVALWIMIVGARSPASLRSVGQRLLVITGCAVLVVVPWTIRNELQFHSFVPVTDSPGLAFVGEYNPYTAAHLESPTSFDFSSFISPQELASRTDSEPQIMAKAKTAAVRYIEAHPSDVPRVWFWNTVHLFDLQGPRSASWIANVLAVPSWSAEVSTLSFYVVGLIALLGLLSRRGRVIPKWILAFPLLWSLGIIVTISVNLYRFNVEPFVVLLAATAAVSVFDRRRSQKDIDGTAPHCSSKAFRPSR
ncbi:MAG: ArnT family glycosyltransferase [Acidimicrobiales bacterium]